jgi:hypothetical protein
LKLQPYRRVALGIRNSLKLATKYYEPFRVLERIDLAAYKLQLPDNNKLHHVFHVSQLKSTLVPRLFPVNLFL